MCGCILMAHRFLEMGCLDDRSYIKTAQVFARTGHLVYNGWATATLGWQVLWDARILRGKELEIIEASRVRPGRRSGA